MVLIKSKKLDDSLQKTSKFLSIGDKLWAESSWNYIVATVVEVADNEVMTDKGYRFLRYFKNGDTYINTDLPLSLDYQYWMLLD